MDPRLAQYMATPVPRYTSYPTAPHFHDGITGDVYGGWLEALDPGEPVSLYLHVPYCRKVCWYCGCNMKLAARYEPVADYVDLLIAEIDLVAARLPGRLSVAHLHWGGGTPTALSPEDLARVMEHVWTRFDCAPDAELAIESDPRTLTKGMTARIGALGFNRASFGVQEFDPDVQAAINRIQPPDMVREAVENLRAVGIRGINFDLIYGLPLQTRAKIEKTVAACAQMRPDRLALFGYAHVPWMAKRQRMIDTETLPGAGERLDQATAAADALVAESYTPVGMDHFALPGDELARAARTGTLKRNFQGYTTDAAGTLIGLGATSIGSSRAGFVQNLADTGAWGRAVQAGELPIAKGIALSDDDRLRSALIERLMCDGRVDVAEVAGRHGASPAQARAMLAEARARIPDGVAEFQGSLVRMADGAAPLIRLAASAFDGYLERSEGRHSVAV